MKLLILPLVTIAVILRSSGGVAGDVFIKSRVARTRCCLPAYAYRTGGSPAVSAVVSEPAILILTTTNGPRTNAFTRTTGPAGSPAEFGLNESNSEPPRVLVYTLQSVDQESSATQLVTEQSRAFVFNDVIAGPLVLSGIAAKTNPRDRTILITGILNHTGGDSGQLLGGKAVIRVEPLSSPGSTAQNATAIAITETSLWVRRNEPETVQILVQYSPSHPGGFGDVDRVRLFLEYHPNR